MENILDSTFYGDARDRKITAIVEKRLVSSYERDVVGNMFKVEKEMSFRRPVVNTGAGFRLIHYLVDMFLVSQSVRLALNLLELPVFGITAASIIYGSFVVNIVIGEFALQKSVGKMLTGSVVINEYAQAPSFGQVILRFLIRLIPFELFSFLGNDRGWHDRWTRTYVVSDAERETLRKLLQDERNFTTSS